MDEKMLAATENMMYLCRRMDNKHTYGTVSSV